jgi:hypothetical protein
VQGISLQGLHAALQHPLISSDARTVCSLLQTCKTWRAALQCAAGNLHFRIDSARAAEKEVQSLQKLALFCSWLKQHAGLVSSIRFDGTYIRFGSTQGGDAYCDAAEQLLALGLQEAAAAPPAAAPMRTALQLRSCSIHCIRSSALLLALPASVTHLDLQHSRAWRSGICFDSSSITAAVAQLSQLRSLMLVGEVGNACIAAVGQLAQLTRLYINKVHVRADAAAAGRCDLHVLPQQLHSLTVTVNSRGHPATVALGHVTALKELKVLLQCSTAPGSSFPSSLTALTVWLEDDGPTAGSAQHLGLTSLQQLQRLSAGGLEQPQQLKQLCSLAALTDVELCYEAAVSAQRAAPGWQQLSMLRSLKFELDCDEAVQFDPTQGAVLLQGLAAATSLTGLCITNLIVDEGLRLCAHLTALSRLQMLAIHNAGVSSRTDALQLTALTSLTQLELSGAAGVDDVAASVLALRLTRLQDLRLTDCCLHSAAALPSIATLTGLTHLELSGGADAETEGTCSLLPRGQEDLMLLSPLTQLKRFYIEGIVQIAAVFRK